MPLITVVSHIAVERQSADIVFSVETVKSEKMSVELFASPVTQFRLNQSVFQPVIMKPPRIIVARYIQRHFSSQTYFYPKV